MTETNARQSAPIISPRSASLLSLCATMTVMCYLACLALAGLIVINRAVENWDKGLSREITVQVQQLTESDIAVELTKATGILKTTKGVLKVEVLDRSVGLKLLEPWLGKSGLEDLPIPRLIRVTIDEAAPPDYKALQADLEANVSGVALDTHGRWRDELSRAGAKMSVLAIAILVLIALASMTLSAFGARAALESNRDTVEVLRLVGAENRFIAGQINRRFLRLGVIAGALGCVMALVSLLALGWSTGFSNGGLPDGSLAIVFAPSGLGWLILRWLLLVPIMSTIFVAAAARLTLMRLLENS
jgi:cell division transport system permease protein